MFRKYPSIDNYKKPKKISAEVFVAIEKIHGSNFSFIYTGEGDITIARRKDIIPKEENFYDCHKLLEKYDESIKTIYNRIKADIEGLISVQVFGEIFGGYYNGLPSTPGSKYVQKGVCYCPHNDIIIFDIMITTEKETLNGKQFFLSYDEVITYMEGCQLKYVPVMAKGSFFEVNSISSIFQTTIPILYNLPHIDGNYAEGYVSKSNTRHNADKPRQVFKHKNNKSFGEVNDTPIVILSETVDDYMKDMKRYITENRFHAVKSKVAIDCAIDILERMYAADVVKDYMKDQEDLIRQDFVHKNLKLFKTKVANIINEEGLIKTWNSNL